MFVVDFSPAIWFGKKRTLRNQRPFSKLFRSYPTAIVVVPVVRFDFTAVVTPP